MMKTEKIEPSGYISGILISSYEKSSQSRKDTIATRYGRDNILAFDMDNKEFTIVYDNNFFSKIRKETITFLDICNLKNINNKDELFNSFYELEAQFNIDELSMDNHSMLKSINNSTSPFYLLNLHQINEFINRNKLLSGDFIINNRNNVLYDDIFRLPTKNTQMYAPVFSYVSTIRKLIELVENKIRKSDTSCYDKEELNKLMFKLETSRALLYIERESVVNGEYGFWLGKKPKWTVSFDYALEYFSTLGKVNASSFYYFFSATIGSLFDNAIKSGNIVDVPHNYSEFYQKLPLNIYTNIYVMNIYAMKVED